VCVSVLCVCVCVCVCVCQCMPRRPCGSVVPVCLDGRAAGVVVASSSALCPPRSALCIALSGLSPSRVPVQPSLRTVSVFSATALVKHLRPAASTHTGRSTRHTHTPATTTLRGSGSLGTTPMTTGTAAGLRHRHPATVCGHPPLPHRTMAGIPRPPTVFDPRRLVATSKPRSAASLRKGGVERARAVPSCTTACRGGGVGGWVGACLHEGRLHADANLHPRGDAGACVSVCMFCAATEQCIVDFLCRRPPARITTNTVSAS